MLACDPLGRFDPPGAGTQALRSTDQGLSAAEVVGYFVRRWPVGEPTWKVTFEEARRDLGVGTQRQ